jgi:hypothetical protein
MEDSRPDPKVYYSPNNKARRALIRGLAEIYANLGAQFDSLAASNQPVPEEIKIETTIDLRDKS